MKNETLKINSCMPTYANEIWTITGEEKWSILTVEMKFLRRVKGYLLRHRKRNEGIGLK